MLGIVTKLPEPFCSDILNLWEKLENEFGFTGIKVMPIPHFTWHVSNDYEINEVIHEIRLLCKKMKPIQVSTEGLSFFVNELFVAYNGIKNTPELKATQKLLCDTIDPYSTNPANYYFPENWVPHVTLVLQDRALAKQKSNLMKFLRPYELNWKFTVDNFLLINQVKKQKTEIEHEFRIK